ncbi:MAG: CoA transferase [Stellaceae bacterium]
MTAAVTPFLSEIWHALGGGAEPMAALRVVGEGNFKSAFRVTDLTTDAIGAAGLAVAELIAARFGDRPTVTVDRRLASLWSASTLRPEGWMAPPEWDPIAANYPASDGWIRLHTNVPRHRQAALGVLGAPADKDAVAAAVARWKADELEAAVVAKGGCAATMRSLGAWAGHPHGSGVAGEPLLWIAETDAASAPSWPMSRARPLAGIRVLDLTRILAGPVATRFLAGFGAELLRIDPPEWDEAIVPEVTLGKRCARLDLRQRDDRKRLTELLAEADVLVHGYRPEALARLGFDDAARRRIRPGLVDVTLDAYGWTGPWAGRRGFDSLVQMSAGIAAEGMRRFGTDHPTPLPVQALDHATGYLLAAAAIRGLTRRVTEGVGSVWRASLARTAALLTANPAPDLTGELAKVTAADFNTVLENTSWGPARRLKPPLGIAGADLHWDRPATALGSAPAAWRQE